MKTKWEKPEIVILLRSRPEEEVLTVCKSNNPHSPSSGPLSTYGKCAKKWWQTSTKDSEACKCKACRGEGGQGS